MKDIAILTKDESLFTLLSIELERLGKTVGAEDTDECRVLIIDVDSFGDSNIKYKKKVFISRREENSKGCDLFLKRPVHIGELCEGISGLFVEEKKSSPDRRAKKDNIALFESERTVSVNSKKIRLSENEFVIFSLLVQKRGEAVSRDELAQRIGAAGNEIDVYVCYLRRKLESGGRRLILTVRGVGYKLI